MKTGTNSKIWILAVVSVLSLILFAGSLNQLYRNWHSHNITQPEYRYLVKLRNLPVFDKANCVGQSQFDKIIRENSSSVEDLYPENNDGVLGRWVIATDKDNIFWDLWADFEDVEMVEDGAKIFRNPEDQSLSMNSLSENDKTWGIRIPKILEGLQILKPTRKIIVGVIDTGCDLKHPALINSLVPGRNFAGGEANDPSNRSPDEMHATHVTGTIVAKPSHDGFFGIAHGEAKVMPIRVLNESGSGTLISVSRGIVYAADHGVNVINMSLGSPSYSRALHDAVQHAVNDKGVTVVCAKGNANSDRPFYPAEFPEVIRVTATGLKPDGTEERAFFSNYGDSSTCAAPGHHTYSTLPAGKYGFASGTSMACPHATACAAVILSQGNFTPKEVKAIIENRGDELKTDKPIGKRINLLKFIEKVKHDLMPISSVKDHPYGKCCVDAGIICRYTIIEKNGVTTTTYEDSMSVMFDLDFVLLYLIDHAPPVK